MKILSLMFSFFISTILLAQDDYTIHINDTVLEISLDEEYKLKIKDEILTIKLKAKDTLVYNDELYSFKYSKDYKVSKTIIEEGMEQIMIMTAEGSGILVQQYMTLNPTALNELMLNEVTKESLNYGFKLDRKDYKRKLASGQKIEVDKAVLSYRDEINIYEIASFGDKDEGVIIMTIRMDDEKGTEGEKIIKMMWDSFEYK